jgi:DNA-binding NarL/FixJ family response regulator
VSPLKVSICHAEAITSAGLAALLAGCPDIELGAGTPADGGWADVVVTDYADAIARLQRGAPGRERVMIVSRRELEWDIRTAMSAGVHGYLQQQCPAIELLSALRALGAGKRYFNEELMARATENLLQQHFTSREKQVLELLALGWSNKQIARDLDIGAGTVKVHMRALFTKLGARARTQAVVLATQRGIVAS